MASDERQENATPPESGLLLIGSSDRPTGSPVFDVQVVWLKAFMNARQWATDAQMAKDVASFVRDRVFQRASDDAKFAADPQAMESFVHTCVRNRHIQLWRARRVREEAAPLVEEDIRAAAANWSDTVALTEIAERRDAINTALLRLPVMRRKVCVLFYVKGMSRQQVADQLGIAETTVAKHIVLANRDLRHALKDYAPGASMKENA